PEANAAPRGRFGLTMGLSPGGSAEPRSPLAATEQGGAGLGVFGGQLADGGDAGAGLVVVRGAGVAARSLRRLDGRQRPVEGVVVEGAALAALAALELGRGLGQAGAAHRL